MNLNITKAAEFYNVSISPKNKEDPEDAILRRFKEKWLFILSMLAICVVLLVCSYILVFKSNSTYAPIALNGIIGITLGLSGYYVRGKS